MNQKPLLGFSLALLASMTWGTLPLAMQQVLRVVDAPTVVWSRFVAATLVLLIWLTWRGKLPQLARQSRQTWTWIGAGCFGLTLNFFFFAKSLQYVAPTTTQVLWQLAPFTMLFCGVLLFKERMGVCQKIGSTMLVLGLGLFFNDKFGEIVQMGSYAIGVAFGAAAAMIWVLYGMAQKVLLRQFSSQQILLLIYFGCAVLMSPTIAPTSLLQLDGFALLCFAYCCANTLIGYGAYGEALNHWDTSKVSVITTMLPIFTMLFSLLAHAIAPNVFPELNMNRTSYVGAFIVVAGAILAVAGDKLWYKKAR